QQRRIEKELGSVKHILVDELNRGALLLARKWSEPHAGLAAVLLLRRRSADNVRDVPNLTTPLTDESRIKLGQVIVVLSWMNRSSHQHRHDSLDVLESERR